MIAYLRAPEKRDRAMPWLLLRRELARQWGCFPWEVDDLPADEVRREMEVDALIAEHLPRPSAG